MKKGLILLGFVLSLTVVTYFTYDKFVSANEVEQKKEQLSFNIEKMLSYTIDGEVASEKPTKESGYIANKIKCNNGSIIVWNNDKWEVELLDVKGSDRCNVDFTKNTSTSGYRVNVASNMENALESKSYATTENGKVVIYAKNGVTIKNVSGCTAEVQGNKAVVSNVTGNMTCNIEIEPTLADVIKAAYPPVSGRTSFSAIDNGTPKLYTGTDDQGTTYYFSGDGTNMNNWVSFAGKKWRIIRINGNGSVRLLYAGTGSTDGYINNTTYQYNSSYNHPAYVGWKYTVGGSLAADRGNANKSNAYSIVESWYNGLSSTDKNYIDTGAIYCNDRNIGSGSYSTSSAFYYAAYTRLYTNKTPIFNCSNTSDRFTTFGLMTADEVSYAGGVYGTNSPKAYYYLNASGGSSTGSNWWWTMSPFYWNGSVAYVFRVYGSGSNPGNLNNANVHSTNGVVRPVVSLKSNVLVTGGSGTGSSPYTLTIQ